MNRILKFRKYLDFSKIRYGDQEYIVVNCMLGLSKEPTLIHSSMAQALAGLLMGVPETEFKYFLAKSFPIKQVSEFVEMLDRLKLLESEEVDKEITDLKRQYISLQEREPWLQGKSFPEDRSSRIQYINELLAQVDQEKKFEADAIILPHIDFQRGWQVYAETIKSVKIPARKRFAVLIGTDHKAGSNLVAVCNKPYKIDGFRIDIDYSGVQFLTERAGDWILEDMIHHKTEHSLEITLPFLETVWSDHIKAIPILVGAVEQYRKHEELARDPQFSRFTNALAEYLSDKLNETVLILGIDFSHLGRSFGDPFEISDELLVNTQQFDSNVKLSFEEQKSVFLFDNFVADNLRQKVCGFSTMVLLREVFDKLGVKIEPFMGRYRQAVNRSNECVVTFWGSAYRFS